VKPPKREFGERWQFKDPCEVMEREQRLTCIGCRNNRNARVKGETWIACRMDMRDPVKSVEDSERCPLYEEK
jgi:hypothetical protein